MTFKLIAALVASTMLAGAADAALLRYELAGTISNKFTASFTLDISTAPSIVTSDSFRFNGVPITYTLPGGTTPFTDTGPFDGVTFRLLANQGGFVLSRLDAAADFNRMIQLFGPQLFTGAPSAPQFLTGTFDLSDISRSFTTDPLQVNYRLVVTDITAGAVPEPASWAMMIAGFGMVGGTMRRRAAVRVTYA